MGSEVVEGDMRSWTTAAGEVVVLVLAAATGVGRVVGGDGEVVPKLSNQMVEESGDGKRGNEDLLVPVDDDAVVIVVAVDDDVDWTAEQSEGKSDPPTLILVLTLVFGFGT